MTASDDFLRAVVAALARILDCEEDVARLGLTADIAGGWRSYFANYGEAEMMRRVRQAASDNKVPLDSYENDKSKSLSERAQAAAEMFIGTVDGFYRRMLTRPN
jgi:hypothetical protein